MKKFFAIALLAGSLSFVACNDEASSTEETKDSMIENMEDKKDSMIDNIDSTMEQKMDNVEDSLDSKM